MFRSAYVFEPQISQLLKSHQLRKFSLCTCMFTSNLAVAEIALTAKSFALHMYVNHSFQIAQSHDQTWMASILVPSATRFKMSLTSSQTS